MQDFKINLGMALRGIAIALVLISMTATLLIGVIWFWGGCVNSPPLWKTNRVVSLGGEYVDVYDGLILTH